MAPRRGAVRSRPSSVEREVGVAPRGTTKVVSRRSTPVKTRGGTVKTRGRSSATASAYAALAKKRREAAAKKAKEKAAKDKAAKDLAAKNAQVAEEKRLAVVARREAAALAKAEAEANQKKQRQDAFRRTREAAEASAKKLKDKKDKEVAERRLAALRKQEREAKAAAEAAKKTKAEKEAKATKDREARARAVREEKEVAAKAAQEAKAAEKPFSLDDLTPKQLAYTKALMDNLGITDESVLYQVARNQFGDGKTLDSNAMNQTFARKDGRSLLSAIGDVGKIQDYQQPQEAPPLEEAPTGSMERKRVVDPIGSIGNSDPEPTPPDTPFSLTLPEYDPDPKLNNLYNSLSYTIQMGAGSRALTQEEAAQQSKEIKDLEQQIIAAGGQPYKYFTNLPFGSFRGEGPDPTLGEYDPMTGRYTDKDDQTSPIEDLFSKFPDLDDVTVTDQGPIPPPDMPPGYPYEEGPRDGPKMGPAPPGFTHHGGISTMALVPFYNPTTGEEWTAPNGGWSPAPGWVQGTKPADWKPPTSEQPSPEPDPEPAPPPPPTFVDMDPLKGMREQFVPRNILGQSYDPEVREDFIKKIQSGANISRYPTYETPTSPIPQTQFGGYGQPMPMSPLAPYAGLGAPPIPPTELDDEPYDEDARPGGPSQPPRGGGVF